MAARTRNTWHFRADGRWWKLVYATPPNRLWGQCDYGARTIYVEPRAQDELVLGTLVHEAAHAELPELSEEAIERLEEAIGKLLWSQGYRKSAQPTLLKAQDYNQQGS